MPSVTWNMKKSVLGSLFRWSSCTYRIELSLIKSFKENELILVPAFFVGKIKNKKISISISISGLNIGRY